jgi:hypothetical protein
MHEIERVQRGNACSEEGCGNFARIGKETCRWHDPEVLALRAEAKAAVERALRAAGVSA